MSEIRYLISDASKKVDVETHVLRYWEEELGLSIPRNEMGHRYYTEFHIRLFCQIKKLKDRGYQLKAIKNALQQAMGQNQGFMQAASILEEDMTRTLQENPEQLFVDKDKRKLPEGIMRLSDYNRLEPVEDIEEKQTVNSSTEKKQSTERTQSTEKIQSIEKAQSTEKPQSIEKKPTEEKDLIIEKENPEKIKWQENAQNNVYHKPELMEKDGKTEMKKKGKNRKKPSAWERRNGIAGNRQEIYNQAIKSQAGTGEYQTEEYYIKEYNTKEPPTEEYEQEAFDTEEYTSEQSDIEDSGTEEYGEETYTPAVSTQNIQEMQAAVTLKETAETAIPSTSTTKSTELTALSAEQEDSLMLMGQEEKMQQFQNIMNHIIGHALEVNNERLSQQISGLVNERITEEMEDYMRVRDERDEERFRQLDEIIRSFQRDSQGRAEAAATRTPFFGKKLFKRHRPSQNN